MPRVLLNRRKYKEQDLGRYLKSYAVRAEVQIKDLASYAGVDKATLYRQFKTGKVPYGTLVEIFSELKLSDAEILSLMKYQQ